MPLSAIAQSALDRRYRLLVVFVRILLSSFKNDQTHVRVDPGLLLLFRSLDRAENSAGNDERNGRCEPKARKLDPSCNGKGCDGVGADDANPRKMDDGGHD